MNSIDLTFASDSDLSGNIASLTTQLQSIFGEGVTINTSVNKTRIDNNRKDSNVKSGNSMNVQVNVSPN